jgi:hypothetical protein
MASSGKFIISLCTRVELYDESLGKQRLTWYTGTMHEVVNIEDHPSRN